MSLNSFSSFSVLGRPHAHNKDIYIILKFNFALFVYDTACNYAVSHRSDCKNTVFIFCNKNVEMYFNILLNIALLRCCLIRIDTHSCRYNSD